MREPSRVKKRHQMERLAESEYSALIETPATVPFTLPTSAHLAVRSTAGNASGALAFTAVGASTRLAHVRALGVNGVQRVGCFQAGAEVTLEAGFELLVDIGLGRLRLIAEP